MDTLVKSLCGLAYGYSSGEINTYIFYRETWWVLWNSEGTLTARLAQDSHTCTYESIKKEEYKVIDLSLYTFNTRYGCDDGPSF